MTSAELRTKLADIGQTVKPGYNYAMFSIRVRNLAEAQVTETILASKRDKIEAEYRRLSGEKIALLGFALVRPRSVVVPIPFEASLGWLAEAIDNVCHLSAKGCKVPLWS